MDLPTIEQRLAVRQPPTTFPRMHQRWESLAFLHWQCDPKSIQAQLPSGLNLDLHDGEAWVGLVPFQMRAIRPVGLPPLPWLSYFLEMNLRTYVFDDQGRPGVWFFSLDCDQPIAVRIARSLFHLPYFDASMTFGTEQGISDFQVQRRGFDKGRFRYRFGSALPMPQPGTLDFFLLERYLLFAWDKRKRRIRSGQVHHQPYQPIELGVLEWPVLPFGQAQLEIPLGRPTHCVGAKAVQVKVYALQ